MSFFQTLKINKGRGEKLSCNFTFSFVSSLLSQLKNRYILCSFKVYRNVQWTVDSYQSMV